MNTVKTNLLIPSSYVFPRLFACLVMEDLSPHSDCLLNLIDRASSNSISCHLSLMAQSMVSVVLEEVLKAAFSLWLVLLAPLLLTELAVVPVLNSVSSSWQLYRHQLCPGLGTHSL